MLTGKDGTDRAPQASSPDTRSSQDHLAYSEEMDSTAPEAQSSQPSPADRGKRAAQSPALSPAKAPLLKKQHWDPPATISPEPPRSESLATLPASDQPASEHTLKLMLLSLQNDIRNELRSSISMLHFRIDQVEDRTDDIEKQLTEHTVAYNEMADAHDKHAEEIQYLQAKVADLEDHSRRNNIKFRGVPESVKAPKLIPYS